MSARNLTILASCQLIGACGSIVMVIVGGIVGARIAAHPELATLPVSLMVVGSALTTIPAALLMRRVGRRAGMSAAAFVGCLAAVLCAYALERAHFALFCIGAFVLGTTMAFVQQYRFAAAESVAPERVSRAISIVLLGAIGGAIVGPELATRGRDVVGGEDYVGTMIGIALLFLMASALLLAMREPPAPAVGAAEREPRPLRTVILQPVYVVAVLAGVVGYGVMSFIMTATPVSMHVIDGHSMHATSNVVRSHVIAMYAPSLFSGFLMERFGVGRVMLVGALLCFVTVAFALAGQAVMHYWLALVMLGVGWNFLYVGGTSLLTRTYRTTERFKAQAVNDFSVFATAALGSLLSGTVIQLWGWSVLVLCALPPLVVMVAALYVVLLRRPERVTA